MPRLLRFGCRRCPECRRMIRVTTAGYFFLHGWPTSCPGSETKPPPPVYVGSALLDPRLHAETCLQPPPRCGCPLMEET